MRFQFADFELDEAERRLTRAGEPLELGDRGFDLLAVLLKSPGRLLGKDALMDAVWPNVFVTENNLQVQVSGLRKLLGPGAISTVAGRGYRFSLPVSAGEDGPGRAETPPPEPGTDAPAALIGREDDVTSVESLLASGGLVTVTGPGGVGKTRLAAAICDAARARGETPAWLDLAGLSEPGLLPGLLAERVGAPDADAGLAAVIAHVRGRRRLIVFDNAEHLLDDVARLVGELGAGAPDAHLLVTSQALLRAPGERAHRLEGLAVTPPGATAEEIGSSAAVRLFVRRAQALDRRFQLTEGNARSVAAVCRRLDGLPLALELAASRISLFGPADLERRLEDRFHLLAQGQRGAPGRQQTLQAMFDWSYGLLPDAERTVFRRLGVFAGPFTLDDACQAARGTEFADWDVIDAIGRLIDRSLVELAAAEAAAFRLTETARAFALDRLAEAGDRDALARGRDLQTAAGQAASARSADVEAVAQLSAALELQRRLDALAPAPSERLKLLLALGPAVQTAISPANRRCGEIYAEAMELARTADDPESVFHATWGYWHYLSMAGEVRSAAPYAEELARLAPTLADDGLEVEAWHATLTTQQLLGDAPAVLNASRRALALYEPCRHEHLAGRFGGHDAGICALGQSSVALWLTGEIGAALEAADQAVARSLATDHAYSRAVGLFYGGMTYQACGRGDAFARAAGALLEVSDSHGLVILRTEGELFRGRAAFDAGDHAAGLSEMRGAYREIVDSGDLGFAMHYAALLAEAELAAGHVAEASARLEQALQFAVGGQGFFLPEVHRLRGRAATAAGDADRAEPALRRALSIAESQGATMLAVRAAADLAELGCLDARQTLAKLVRGLTSQPETPDLLRSRALVG